MNKLAHAIVYVALWAILLTAAGPLSLARFWITVIAAAGLIVLAASESR